MTITRTGASASPRAAYNPPKPPPTMTTLGRPAVLRTPLVVLSEVITIASPIKYDGPCRLMEARNRALNPTNVQFPIPNSYPRKPPIPLGCGFPRMDQNSELRIQHWSDPSPVEKIRRMFDSQFLSEKITD